jgi:hypothetical protein
MPLTAVPGVWVGEKKRLPKKTALPRRESEVWMPWRGYWLLDLARRRGRRRSLLAHGGRARRRCYRRAGSCGHSIPLVVPSIFVVGDKEARLPAFLMGSREGGIMDVLLYHRGAAGFGNEIFIVRLRLASLLLQNNH